MKPIIIVSGAHGQLGYEIQQLAANYPEYHFEYSDHDTVDITSDDAVKAEFEKCKPVYFINCAAYTAVDKAETEKEKALVVNATAVGIIAKYCKIHNTKLIHISTDYVFNGKGSKPYLPYDPTDPVNYYGETKLQGEILAKQNNPQTIIIRTSWVYSTHGHNFVKTMLRLMNERDELNVVSDQVGSPTHAKDLASAILQVIKQSESDTKPFNGIYHYSNSGVISWYDFAVAIRDMAKLNCNVNPIATSAYPTPAARPAYSVMEISDIHNEWNVAMVPWQKSLECCLNKLLQS